MHLRISKFRTPWFIKQHLRPPKINATYMMGFKWSVAAGCRSGYVSRHRLYIHRCQQEYRNHSRSTVFRKKAVFEKWPKYPRVGSIRFCSLDFFTTESKDSDLYRNKNQTVKKNLKVTAVPHRFINVPAYLTKSCVSEQKVSCFSCTILDVLLNKS